jgi:thiamine pyridinylase
VTVDAIDLSGNYYNPNSSGFIGSTSADVYELDSVFLADFAQGNHGFPRLQSLPLQLIPTEGTLLRSAVRGAQVNATWYGEPHWVCSNFLFYRSNDAALAAAQTVADLRRVWPSQPMDPSKGLLIDLKGKSTLGEFYLMAEVERTQDLDTVYKSLAGPIDVGAENDLMTLRRYCATGYCRDQDIHDNNAVYYAQKFAHNNARAYVGYSEGIHDVLAESALKCLPSDQCLKDSDIAVSPLPLDERSAMPMVWVDSFAIASSCTGRCLSHAIAFIKYAAAKETVLRALLSDSRGTPRYLMPARADLYSNAALVAKAHLYPKLRLMVEHAAAPSTLSLNSQVRNAGSILDSYLGP